jgi:nucleoside-diphosphate-sugar epimerase
MNILITGIAGFIGSKVAELLALEGHNIIGVDNFNNYYEPSIKEIRYWELFERFNIPVHRIDIENYPVLRRVFSNQKIDAVINLAARAGVRASLENPFVYFQTNVNGSLNLLELMNEFGVKKYVVASSSSLYADCPMPYDESQPVNQPISPYAASKKAAEVMAYTYHKQYGIDVSILRYFTVYGPLGRPDMSVYRFIKAIAEEKALTLYGDGEQARDFTYINDIALGTIAALKPLGYEIINLGGGNNPVTINTLIAELEKIIGKKAQIDYQDSHAADVKVTWAKIDKAKSLLDWQPQVNLKDGLKNAVEKYFELKEKDKI